MISASSHGVVIDVRVIPRAGRAGFAGVRDNAVLIRVRAAPVEGAANAEVIELIARVLGVKRSAVSILSGEHSRLKRVHVRGVLPASVEPRLRSAR